MSENEFTDGDWSIQWCEHGACDTIFSKEADEVICTNVEEHNAHLLVNSKNMYDWLVYSTFLLKESNDLESRDAARDIEELLSGIIGVTK